MKSKDIIILKKILDYQSAWDTIQIDLPELKSEISNILNNREGIIR